MEFAALKDLYDRCDPSEPLRPGDPRYVDLDEARDVRWVDVLERRLGLARGPVQLLVAGGRGAGKTTELLRLAERIAKPESAHLLPVYVPVEGYHARPGEIDALHLGYVMLDASSRALQIDEEALRSNRAAMAALYAADHTKFFAWLNSIFLRYQTLVGERGYAGLLLIVDSLDRENSSGALSFQLDRFNELGVSTIYVVPMAMSARADVLALPMARLLDRDGTAVPEGLAAMSEVLRARGALESVAFRDDTPGTQAGRFLHASGGCVGALLRLVRELLDEGNLPPRVSDLSRVLAAQKKKLRFGSPAGSLGEWLRQVAVQRPLARDGSRELERVLSLSDVLAYAYGYSEHGELWFDVHPALREALRPDTAQRAGASLESVRVEPTPRHLVSRVHLADLGPFPTLSLDLRPGWNVLLGDNGCGKTSVIRAIALALAGTDPRAAIASQRQLRAGASTGTVTVTTDAGEYSTTLSRLSSEVRASAPADTLTQQGRWLALGFPAMRGISSRAISGPTSVTPPVPGAYDLLPLLEGVADSRLDDTRQWIVNTALRAEGNEGEEVRARYSRLLARWFELLRELMPGLQFGYERVDRESWQVLVKTADGTIPMEQLSQGMVSTIGWIGTLLRRLYEAFPQSARPEHEPALVLVDELDAHLHPEWQQRVVPLVREHFPNVQVIATSHSPLVVSNLEPDEVVVFSRDAEGRITAARNVEPLKGYRADQVLTSGAFGLKTTRSEYATRLLNEYAEALSQGADSPETHARLAELTERVRREIPSPPETVEERRAVDESVREVDEAVRRQLDEAAPEEVERVEALLKARLERGDAA